MSDIVWEDPPEDARRRGPTEPGKWCLFVRQLRERPGCWAKYADDMAVGSNAQMRMSYPDTIETAQAGTTTGRAAFYVRWVGEG